jgi:hypothetical protein
MTEEAWKAVPVPKEETSPELLYEISKQHRLIPENVIDAVDFFARVAADARMVSIMSDGEKVGDLIFTDIVDGESASLTFIPVPKFFAPGREYRDMMFDLVNPILVKLMDGRGLRRITSIVPESRCRTKKALIACGFKVEGVMPMAIKLKGKRPESATIMGILPKKEN